MHPTRGAILLMSTNLTLRALDIIRIDGLRFKIDHMSRQAVDLIGSFFYQFWMMDMKPLRYRNGNQYLHRELDHDRDQVRRKVDAYHASCSLASLPKACYKYLSVEFTNLVWESCGSRLRTVRQGTPPSELVVDHVMRETISDFSRELSQKQFFRKIHF
jgi:hypothetical protein